jgi:hypothetical protein
MFNPPAASGSAPTRRVHAAGTRWLIGSLLFFAGMAVLHTWPLAAAPGAWSRHDNGDAMLNEWIVAWIAHQLPHNPLHLFDANIFYPEPNSLAFSEHMFVPSLMGAPLLWAGASTLLVHNVLVLGGLALTGWTMCVVMYRWTGDYWAAIVAGLLLAFNAHSLTRLANLQAMHVEFLPLALYAIDRLLIRPTTLRAIGLGLAIALQALTSNYLLVMMAFAMAAAAAIRADEWLDREHRRTLVLLVIAAALASAMLLPFLLPYLHAQRDQGLTRSLRAVAVYDASWRDYLTTGGRVHQFWSARFQPGMRAALFPGFVAVALAGVAIVTGSAWRNRAARVWIAVALVGLLLSFGTRLPGYVLLYRVVPLLQGIRATVRFGYLALAGVAGLAGFGLAWVNQLPRFSPRGRTILGVVVATLVTIESARLPFSYVPGYQVPEVYHALALDHPHAVVELPLPPPLGFGRNAPYMLNSMLGWWPLVNGYSGFMPESYFARRVDLAQFPADDAIAVLRRLGVSHVVVHREEFSHRFADALQRLDAAKALRPVAADADIAIYRVASEDPR